MDRINLILQNHEFRKNLQLNKEAEVDRIFCKHTMKHLLDVARIAYIIVLEKELGIKKDIVYGTALLHDIGKHLQYKEGIPHEVASAALAKSILKDCGYKSEEILFITDAILSHREEQEAVKDSFHALLYYADKRSRLCYSCKAVNECNWSDEKKNLKITY